MVDQKYYYYLKQSSVEIDKLEFEPQHDRIYVPVSDPLLNSDRWHTGWSGPLFGRNPNYYNPSGWGRLSLKTSNMKWEGTGIMYHGLLPESIVPIISQHGCKATYLTPSIKYAAHPRYSRVNMVDGMFVQFVLEVRVPIGKLTAFKGETMQVGNSGLIDDNFPDNNGMEFLWKSDEVISTDDGLVVTGIMMRVLPTDPLLLKESLWWTKWRTDDMLRQGYYIRR
eukprot:NODE_7065_length_814_cov_39.610709_g6461_i0.p1 GENE.NODE_7065_length_814_cov_39.610709_g6461_i0~~NODE_7065_length_814_cov_39.610709_g6461_i0.p1  ORF type:complete len:243 (+),score=39.35 NODE_7065_length_814_cov_39.610709_g6461_i0:60-731(+)